jgi:hypothetical protein
MTALIISAAYNTPGINPATGTVWRDADEFLREALLFAGEQGVGAIVRTGMRVRRVDNRKAMSARFRELVGYMPVSPVDARGMPLRYDTFGFFCHGWQKGVQLGADMLKVKELARAMRRCGTDEPVVALYACSTAGDADGADDERQPGPGGEGGFADALRDALVVLGARPTVYAHTTKGHCTKNPWVRRFGPDDFGGEWLVEPNSPRWNAWCHWLRADKNRFRFLRMSREEISAAIGGEEKQ